MSLINCPECSNRVSDAASQCPKCGIPIKSQPGPPLVNATYAPESDDGSTLTDETEYLKAFVGPKWSEFYKSKFAKFRQGGTWATWNWVAFFFTSFWFLSRKMWLYWVLYTFVLSTGLSVLIVLLQPLLGLTDDQFAFLYLFLWVVTGWLLVPVFANALYYRYAQKKIEKAKIRAADKNNQLMYLARAGGTSAIAIVILLIPFIGIFAAITIPAYQDYTIRAQVSEGISLSGGARAAVEEYVLDQKAYPQDNEAAGLMGAEAINGKYVSAVFVTNGNITTQLNSLTSLGRA
jgi:Tfp pilus assembly major pilin PilA